MLFYDAGEVKDVGERFSWKEPIYQTVAAAGGTPVLKDPYTLGSLLDPNAVVAAADRVVVGQTSAFKTSTGAEIRFFMPVLNVPFRLIFAYNPQRGNVLDNQLLPQKKFTFRFAVGSTF